MHESQIGILIYLLQLICKNSILLFVFITVNTNNNKVVYKPVCCYFKMTQQQKYRYVARAYILAPNSERQNDSFKIQICPPKIQNFYVFRYDAIKLLFVVVVYIYYTCLPFEGVKTYYILLLGGL